MPIVLTFEADDADDLMLQLRGFLREQTAPANVVPLKAATALAETADVTQGAAPEALNRKSGPTVDELKAGMRLKETATASIADGHRVAPGDYVMYNGEAWHVCVTYRGTIIALNEEGKADVLQAAECQPAPSDEQPEPARLRPGTAGALLAQPDPQQKPVEQAHAIGAPTAAPTEGPIDPKVAADLRDRATDAVATEKVTVEAVFGKLQELGKVSQIDMLTAAQGAQFDAWLSAATSGNPKFGF
jgi:hypothetical protein